MRSLVIFNFFYLFYFACLPGYVSKQSVKQFGMALVTLTALIGLGDI